MHQRKFPLVVFLLPCVNVQCVELKYKVQKDLFHRVVVVTSDNVSQQFDFLMYSHVRKVSHL